MWLVGLSLVNAFGMNLHTIATQYEKQTSFLTLIGQMQVLYAFVVDVGVFKVRFNGYELFGAGLFLVFNLTAMVSKLTKK